MCSMFPRLGRFDDTDTDPIRLWTWSLFTVDDDSSFSALSGATSINNANMYSQASVFATNTMRILQQGVAPVYFTHLPQSDGLGGPLHTDSTGSTVTVADSPWGPARVDFDVKGPFGLREHQRLCLAVAPAVDDPNWVEGDFLDVEYYAKHLWQERR